MNGFYLECHFILRKCWFEVGQSEFKHPVYVYMTYWQYLIKVGRRRKKEEEDRKVL